MASNTRDERVIAAVPCPTCKAAAGTPCQNPVPHQTHRGPGRSPPATDSTAWGTATGLARMEARKGNRIMGRRSLPTKTARHMNKARKTYGAGHGWPAGKARSSAPRCPCGAMTLQRAQDRSDIKREEFRARSILPVLQRAGHHHLTCCQIPQFESHHLPRSTVTSADGCGWHSLRTRIPK